MRITFDEIESLAQSPLSFPALCERYPDDKPLRDELCEFARVEGVEPAPQPK